MKAAIALLTDHRVQNFARKVVLELEKDYQIEFLASRLPTHISLKQPFSFQDMEKLESYFDSLAAQIVPFKIELDNIYCTKWSNYGILGLNVIETDTLRKLHNQLNRELSALFKDTSAPFDGDEYHFHMTIEMGKVGEVNPYQVYFDHLQDKRVDLSFLVKEIALFYYPDWGTHSFINYKVLPLTGSVTE